LISSVLGSPFQIGILNAIVRCGLFALVISCGVVLAQLILSVVAGADWNRSIQTTTMTSSETFDRADLSALERITPFRVIAPEISAAADFDPASDTPETRLDLTLHGFRLDGDATTSIAVISSEGGDQQDYRVGDPIKGLADVYLVRIYADGVVIERQDENEWLPKLSGGEGGRIVSVGSKEADPGMVAEASPRRTTNETPDPEASGSGPENEEERASPPSGPESRQDVTISRSELVLLAESIRFEGRSGSGEDGYTVFPKRNLDIFSRAGLRAGDVVTRVNGTELTASSDLEGAMAGLGDADTIEVSIRRDAETIALVISIGQ